VRILLLSTSMGMGGADKLLLTAAQTMRSHGHEILIVSLTPLGPMGFEARSLGISIESLAMRRGVPDPRGLVRLVRLIRSWRPDVVHSHMVHANLMARVARVFVRIPVLVSTIHNIYEGDRLRMAATALAHGAPGGAWASSSTPSPARAGPLDGTSSTCSRAGRQAPRRC
jgi:hypothetical protein